MKEKEHKLILLTYYKHCKHPNLIFKLCILSIILCTVCSLNSYSLPSKFRLVGIGDISTEMTLIYDASNNSKVYYGLSPNLVNSLTSSFISPISVNDTYGMQNNICRLTNLQPNTKYYFKVVDDEGSSELYHFYTLPNDYTPLSLIAGSCSQRDRSARQSANKMVANLKAHAVIFTGDFTDYSSVKDWQDWFEHWQSTIDTDGRHTPIIPARGNRENNNRDLSDLFGINANAYYASFNNSLLSIITLNTEIRLTDYSDQTSWLQNTLAQTNTTYKIMQYHKPMRMHTGGKIDNAGAYFHWAKMFDDYDVDLVIESDSQTSKTTWPVSVCTGGLYCVDGFRRNDANGVVYTGEGGWGTPLRSADDNRIWTHQSGSFNQFKWIFVFPEKMELRTVKYINSLDAPELDINNRFQVPQGIDVFGDVTTIEAPNDLPAIRNFPENNSTFVGIQPVTLGANIENSNKTIDQVSFYINGILVRNFNTAPYQFDDWTVLDYGVYTLTTITKFSNGETKLADSHFQVIEPLQTDFAQLNSSFDDAEQSSNNKVDVTNYDLDLGYNGTIVGLRFQNVNIPPNATVINAYIQFTADERKINPTTLTIYGEQNANAETFAPYNYNISNRKKTMSSVIWNASNWETVGNNGAAEQTPDVSNIMNEIINLNGFSLEHPIAFIIEGSGYRVSESYDSDSTATAVLHYSYSINCQANIVITANTSFSNSYASSGTISTSGIVLIDNLQQVEYKSNEIVLNGGFSVEVGAIFEAKPGSCNY